MTTLLLGVTMLPWSGPTAVADVIEANLMVVGRSDLNGGGSFGDVTVVATTAVVAVGPPPAPGCASPSDARVVDIKDPRKPRVSSVIPIPPGMGVDDVESASVATAMFTGDLVALAVAPLYGPCGDGMEGFVAYYDVTDPDRPQSLGRSAGCRSCGSGRTAVSLATRTDGRVLAARVDGAGIGVAIDDVSDPARPAALALWTVPPPAGGQPAGSGCLTTALVGARFHDDGEGAVVVISDGRVYDLDLSDPSLPFAAEPAPAPGDALGRAGTHAAIVPLVNRTIAIVAEEGIDASCADPPADRGLRVLALDRGAAPREESPVRFPGAMAPGRLVASGALAYVAWHKDGVRVIDFGQVRARTVAQFVPIQADVVGVGLLPEHVVVTDRASGLYVLERPDEGGARAAFWSQFLSLLPYLGFAAIASALVLVPRLVAGRGAAPSPAGSPAPTPVRRRA